MTMQSLALLPDLRKLPAAEDTATLDYDETVARIHTMDRGHFAIEVSQATEEVLEALFEWRNVPDVLNEAYLLAFSSVAQRSSLHDRFGEIQERGPRSVEGFVSNLKGKVAELKAESILEERHPGYDFRLAESPTEPVWDLRGTSSDGPDIDVQVKIRAEGYAEDVVNAMQEHPNMPFVVSSEAYAAIEESYPELLHRAVDLEPSSELNEFVTEGLDRLAENLGVDVPDSLGEALPLVAEVVLGIKLIWGIVSTERALSDVDLSDRSRLHGIRTLALASRFGINQLCMWAGGAGGTVAGTVVPGVGNVVAGLGGGLAGMGGGMVLNKLLQPRIEEVSMKLIGEDADDLLYLMNKVEIDRIGESLAATQVDLIPLKEAVA